MAATSIQFESNRLSNLIGLGYEAALTRSAWRAFADDLATASNSQLAMIQYNDETYPERSFLVCGGLGTDFKEAFAQTSWQSEEDRFWTAIRNKSAGTVKLSHEIMAPSVMRRSPYYARVAMPWKLEHFLISKIDASDNVSAFLSLGRTAKKKPYLSGDKALFGQRVLAHLRRSLTIARQIDEAREASTVMSAIFDKAPYGMVVFDTSSRIVAVNHSASEIFAATDGLSLVNGRLHAAEPAAQAGLERALSLAVHGALGVMVDPPAPVIIARRDHANPHQVVFSQLSFRNNAYGLPARSAVVALIHEGWLTGEAYLPMILRSYYGLTRSEIRLCQAMLGGRSLLQAAASASISRNTAKTHLSRIFDKMGVSSQAALLRLLAKGTRPKVTNP